MPKTKFQNVVFTADWLPNWLTQWAVCLPMAFFWQLLYAGPVVRLILRTIFRNQLAADETGAA